MAKSDVVKLTERLSELQELLAKKTEIEDRLMYLTGIKREEKKAELKPDGFSVMAAIREALTEANRPLKVNSLCLAIKARHNFEPEPASVRTTAKYMVNKGVLIMNDVTKEFSLIT
ncbi:MAG: hypothetical protein WAZ14_03150 [Patescibacteria group bacterium]